MEELKEELFSVLYDKGASMIGIADLRDIPESRYPVGICMLLAEPKERIETELAEEYFYNVILDEMAKAGVDFLRRKGFSAAADTASMQSADHCAALPHKTVAVKAGLGWIGKNSLLVTEAFGSAFRMTVLLTNAPLPANHAILESNCRDCRACVDACPAKALTGNDWKIGISREELIDIFSCNALFERQMADTVDTCTKCLDVCPYTYRYFKQDTEEY